VPTSYRGSQGCSWDSNLRRSTQKGIEIKKNWELRRPLRNKGKKKRQKSKSSGPGGVKLIQKSAQQENRRAGVCHDFSRPTSQDTRSRSGGSQFQSNRQVVNCFDGEMRKKTAQKVGTHLGGPTRSVKHPRV